MLKLFVLSILFAVVLAVYKEESYHAPSYKEHSVAHSHQTIHQEIHDVPIKVPVYHHEYKKVEAPHYESHGSYGYHH